jgi:CRISPR-associated endoribonuclease Cas6
MRLLIKLRSVESSLYEMQYHYHLQGFIYNLLKGSKYHHIHNKEGYKFFCFSNIFPAMDLKENDLRTLIISSPDEEFISYLYELMQQLLIKIKEIKVGGMKFRIDSVNKLVAKLPNDQPFTLITGTPIVVRIPMEKYKRYVSEPPMNYDYIYWRFKQPVDLFISQLENNLLRKYNEYYGFYVDYNPNDKNMTLPPFSIIQKFKFKKQVSTKILMKGIEQIIIGTVWEFEFESCNNKRLIQFALDAGLGERNSLGFGFMNLLRKNVYN